MPQARNFRSGAYASGLPDNYVGEDAASQLRGAFADHVIPLGRLPVKGKIWHLCLASMLVALITVSGFWIAPIVGGPYLIVLYMLGVVFSALRWGRWVALVGAGLSALLFDYYFVTPNRRFAVTDFWYLITLLSLLAVAFIVSTLAANAREDARLARTREAYTATVYAFTESLAAASSLEQILQAIGQHIGDAFHRPLVILLPGNKGLEARFCSADFIVDENESAAAAWAFENGQAAGNGMFPAAQAHYLPLRTWRGTVGVLGFQPESSTTLLPADQQQLLGAFVNQAALAITRAQLAEEAQRAKLLQETDKLQKALLNSISHNLRTPMASVTGALNSVLEDGHLLDPSTQRELLETAREESKRLDRLLRDLLDMTRLEGNAIHIKTELCDVQDVVGAALAQLGQPAKLRRMSVVVPPDLPLIPMDSALIAQVIVNLLENALKYSEAESPIAIEAQLAGDELQLSVLDGGNGIPEEDVERVFEKFYRGASAGGAKGAGLGLSICKGFIEAHNGRIWVERRPQGGTEVKFTVPTEQR
jgi:two-component system, OmpR family, sensor histidine kinase KdpD